MTTGINNVVCGVLVRSNRVLLVHRNAQREWAPNCWDAPGGHVESGESDLVALSRELREEIGITVVPECVQLVARLTGDVFDQRVFYVKSWIGEPENRAPEEHDDLCWFEEENLLHLVLADNELLRFLLQAIRHDGDTDGAS